MSTIYLIGDSTVDDNTPPFRGWGFALPSFVREGVRVCNHALSGCSTRSFWEQNLFAPVYEAMQPGDLLMIQFGHNDEKNDERHTDPHTTYTQNLQRYCRMAQDKGAQPILVTPLERRFFMGDTDPMYTHGEYPLAVRTLAASCGIPLCDLSQDSRELYHRLGKAETAKLFVQLAPGEHPDFPDGHDDFTHLNEYGARVIAELVVGEMQQLPECRDFVVPKNN